MPRLMLTLALSLLAIGISNAAEPGAIAGNWIFTFKADQPVQVLVVLTNDDGKLVADVVDTQPELFDQRQQPVTLKTGTFSSTGKSIALTVLFNDSEAINLDGTLTEDGKLIRGSLKFLGDPDLRVVELRRTKLKKLSDPVAVAQEEFARLEDGQGLFDAGFTIVKNAAESKLSVEEARGIADKMLKAATAYGARWERSVVQQLATQFAKQEGFAEVGLSLAQRAERMLPEGASLPEQMEVMGLVAMALERSGKADDAKKLQANLQRLEIRDAAEYLKTTQTFETPAFAGRKKPSERVVLVELFTGAEDATCLVPTVAVDALQATYKPNDVTVMQYHVPAGGADPLMCKDGLERQLGLFGRIGAPVILVNGRPLGRGAGTGEAKERYQQLCESINEQLELPATAKLTCAITKDGEAYKATAKVTDLEAPGDKVNLRFALVEPKLRYPGSSGVRFHSQTVRAMPGSSKGFPLLKKENEETVTFKLADVKTEHEKFLDEFAKLQSDFPRAERPFALKNLKLVVFIQNDATFEVLNAVTLDLDSK